MHLAYTQKSSLSLSSVHQTVKCMMSTKTIFSLTKFKMKNFFTILLDRKERRKSFVKAFKLFTSLSKLKDWQINVRELRNFI